MFTNIEEFQIRQKLMEEKNKMTKELLSKAISDRYFEDFQSLKQYILFFNIIHLHPFYILNLNS